jgi:hypothetical protein
MQAAQYISDAIPRIKDEDWLNNAWEAELMSLPDPPEELDEVSPNHITKYLVNAAREIRNELERRQEEDSEDADETETSISLWTALQHEGLDYKNMLPVLCSFITNGSNNFEETDIRKLGLQATSCYFLLLAMPGSVIYNVYHSIMYTHGLNTLKLAIKICVNKRKPTKRAAARERQMDEGQEGEGGMEDRLQLSESERAGLVSQLHVVLSDLLMMLKNFSLKSRSDALEHTVQQLTELTYLEHEATISNFTPELNHASHDPRKLAAAAYMVSTAYYKSMTEMEH